MSSTLGLYIEDNLIKYAKVSKSNDNVKVEAFGIKFYDKLEETLKQIVEETYSYKIPISVNLAEEQYNYYDVFGMLNKKDIEGIVKTSFENDCYDNGINKDSFEQRFLFTSSPETKEKLRAIYISAPKTAIARRKNQLTGLRVTNISPIGVAAYNLVKEDKRQNSIIINMEENTTITQIDKENIKKVKVLPYGSKEILNKINSKENSYAKAYEICKNTTIYTNEGKDLQFEENEYLEDIMPTLYKIATELKQFTGESLDAVNKIYITGTLSVINNIDIYFQDFFKNIQCEVLKPYFINSNSKINIKDYIEVNSAIALALQGLEGGVRNVNFIKETSMNKFKDALHSDIKLPKLNELDFSNLYDNHKSIINISTFTLAFSVVFYIILTFSINSMINNKEKETEKAIAQVNQQINELSQYDLQLNNRITRYKSLITNIEQNNEKASEDKRFKNTIPNLLNNLMAIIPKDVELVSIENKNDTHVVIEARSKKYEKLAFFKTKIKTEDILLNVISDTGVGDGEEYIKITIEGELP